MEFLAFATRQFAPKIVDLSVRFSRILFYSSMCANAAGGGNRPRSEAPGKYMDNVRQVLWATEKSDLDQVSSRRRPSLR